MITRYRPTFQLALATCFLSLSISGRAAEDTDNTTQPIALRTLFAIDRGLQFLATQQNADGSFTAQPNQAPAITSLATLAFLARGHLPGQGPYGSRINHAIDWVLTQQQSNGLFGPLDQQTSMYNHGICTIMLTEVYAMTDPPRQKRIHTALAAALKLILVSQRNSKSPNDTGGWRYTPTSSDSDLSVTGWQLMALRSAANIGALLPKSSIDNGVAYIKRLYNDRQNGFSYRDRDNTSPARAAIGILSLELLGEHKAPATIAAGEYLMTTPPINPRATQFYYYSVYYCAQAVNQLGGKYWDNVYPPLRDNLLSIQATNGSWPSALSYEGANDTYSTAMALLALNVPLHYLPLYQK